jgi:hypothetical protein
MAYDPLTGRYTPDPVPTSGVVRGFTPYITTPAKPVTVGPVAPRKAATPGEFRRAEEASNVGAPVYTPTTLTETGQFVEQPLVTPQDTATATQNLLLAQQQRAQDEAARRDRQSAYDILYNEFNRYGLGSLVEDVKYLIQSNVSPSQFALELQNTESYKKRFSANQDRIKAGLRALSPAEYVSIEDQYQNIMRNYGLPASYYTKDATGKQSGFDKFIAGDVSATELEDRISTAQKRVINANPQVSQALKQFYPDINNSDILAYVLDPAQGLDNIKRKVTAAEIGGAALAQGLTTGATRAEELAGYGVTKDQAQQGFQAVAGVLPRGSQLADIYGATPYTQQTAEAEVFGLAGSEEAARQRKKLVGLEKASFSGTAGAASGALGRERAMGQGQI